MAAMGPSPFYMKNTESSVDPMVAMVARVGVSSLNQQIAKIPSIISKLTINYWLKKEDEEAVGESTELMVKTW